MNEKTGEKSCQKKSCQENPNKNVVKWEYRQNTEKNNNLQAEMLAKPVHLKSGQVTKFF